MNAFAFLFACLTARVDDEQAAEAAKMTSRKPVKATRGWASNPVYHVTVTKSVQVEITLARHDDCWGKQKEQVRYTPYTF